MKYLIVLPRISAKASHWHVHHMDDDDNNHGNLGLH